MKQIATFSLLFDEFISRETSVRRSHHAKMRSWPALTLFIFLFLCFCHESRVDIIAELSSDDPILQAAAVTSKYDM